MDWTEFWSRVKPHWNTKRVVIGKERMEHLLRQHEAGLVCLTEDMAKNAKKKLIKDCLKREVPCIVMGDSSLLEEEVFIENIKCITLRKSFPGLNRMIEQLQDEIYTG